MPQEETRHFLGIALDDPKKQWARDGIAELAQLNVPDVVLGQHRHLLRADVYRLWAEWFLEAMHESWTQSGDPGYAVIYQKVESVTAQLFAANPIDERQSFADTLTGMIRREIQRRIARQRSSFTKEEVEGAYLAAGTEPRCYICGFSFPGWALDKFFRRKFQADPLPDFVDIAIPRANLRHYTIEIDHVVPIDRGGTNTDNLRLACGWCNGHKREYISVYDAGSRPIITQGGGSVARPHPLWVIRVLASRPRCEHEDGCNATVQTAALTVAPRYPGGAMNPVNMRVTCEEHDPLGSKRLVSRAMFETKRKTPSVAA